MLALSRCNPFVRAAMIQETVMEGNAPRIPYDRRIFLVLAKDAVLYLNGREFKITENTLICMTLQDSYYFKGKFKAAVINYDLTMSCYEQKTPLCPVSKEFYDETLIFDKSTVEGFNEPIVMNADNELREAILALVDTFVSGGRFCDALCSAKLKNILVNILICKSDLKSKEKMLTERVLGYIKENASSLKKNTDVAEAFGYHPVYLSEIFKKSVGRSIHAVIIEEKLRIAARRLIYTNDSVEEIAYKIGFSSRNHLCTVFKKHFGVTPLEYRAKRSIGMW